MFYQSIVIMCSMLALVCSSEYQEMKLIAELNNFFKFDYNIFLIDTTADVHPFINGSDFTPRSMFDFQGSDRFLYSEKKILSKNTFMIVVLASCKFNKNSNLLERVLDIQRLILFRANVNVNMKIGIFFTEFASSEDLQELFDWCKTELIVNIFAATHLNVSQTDSAETFLNIFTYNPFTLFDNVVNLTSSGYESFFANTKSKYRQLKVKRRDTEFSDSIILPTGFDINEFYMDVRRNYTESELDDFEKGIDAIPAFSFECDIRVYPVLKLPQVIVVPQALPYSDFSAYLRTFASDQFFGYSLITVTVVMLLLSIIRYVKQKKILFFQSVADVVNLLINDNGYINYQRLSCSENFLIVPLTFVGLVFVNGILSTLQSFFTEPIYQPQINSLEDLYSSDIHILTWNEYWKDDILSELMVKSTLNWTDKIVVVDEEELSENISRYDRIAFITSLNVAQLLSETQKRLNIRGYHITQVEIGKLYFSYMISDKFLFFERLSAIVQDIQCGGLYDQWTSQDFARYETDILKKHLERFSTQEAMSAVNRIEFPICIAYGWLAGIIVFVVEIIWRKICDFRILHGMFK